MLVLTRWKGAARTEDAQGIPTQSQISPSILVSEDYMYDRLIQAPPSGRFSVQKVKSMPRALWWSFGRGGVPQRPHPLFSSRRITSILILCKWKNVWYQIVDARIVLILKYWSNKFQLMKFQLKYSAFWQGRRTTGGKLARSRPTPSCRASSTGPGSTSPRLRTSPPVLF